MMIQDKQYDGTLVLVIRGWTDRFMSNPGGEIPPSFIKHIKSSLPGAETIVPELDMGIFSTASPDNLVEQLIAVIDKRFAERPFGNLVIVAFSAGTLLARNLFSVASGAQKSGHIDTSQSKPWASRVKRILMLAGVTRGWCISSATPANLRFFAPVLLSVVNLRAWLSKGHHDSFIQQLKRGSPFVIESRLKFLQIEQDKSTSLPHTVLLLGSKDEFVSPLDAMDLGPRESFSYIEVPQSTHIEMLDVGSDTPEAQSRAEFVTLALTATPKELTKVAINPDDIDDYLDELDRPVDLHADKPHRNVEKVVFVVHGIRDNGFWTKRIAHEIKEIGRGQTLVIRAPSPSYGYFSMWDFINFWGRRDATYWFLEKYAEIKVIFPDASISYVGHSNGTFIAAHALKICEMVELERIVFAGSVVRSDFGWGEYSDRVEAVLNLVATADWVVACLPGAFERLGLRFFGVGGAGFDGIRIESGISKPKVKNFRFLEGGHSVGVSEPLWHDIAEYVVNNNLPAKNDNDPSRPKERSRFQKFAGSISHFTPIVIIGLLITLFYVLTVSFQGWGLVMATTAMVIFIQNIIRFY